MLNIRLEQMEFLGIGNKDDFVAFFGQFIHDALHADGSAALVAKVIHGKKNEPHLI